jgi:5-methylcytosine-specific restriction endonuclease McrA
LSQLEYEYGHKTIQDLVGMFDKGQLNLEPGFQRNSVWRPSDRRKLIESIFNNYPIPSIFLYKRERDRGGIVYDVIDGKQRLETILMFQGLGKFRGKRFSAPLQIDSDNAENWDWQRITRQPKLGNHLLGYKIQIVEIEGGISDIIELFVRINSTGKSLTSAEKRHAKYYNSTFLQEADRLAKRCKHYFSTLFSSGQISRMKHVELVCELMASIYKSGIIDKKKAIDEIMAGNSFDGRSLERCSRQFLSTLNLVKTIFPDIVSTRFKKAVDFYSIFLILYDMDSHGCVLTDKKRNRQAQELLIWLSNGVDGLRQKTREGKGASPEEYLFREYFTTIQDSTDSLGMRESRSKILHRVFAGLFEKKDSRRHFTPEQRRLFWNSKENKKCAGSDCRITLTWNNFTIDHVKAHTHGGRTNLSNAGLMCRSCNSSKGAR